MTNAERLLGVARSQVGIKENPAGSNNVQYNTWYYGRTVYGSDYSWCMTFVQWCFEKTNISLPYLTASCGTLLRWYKAHQPECIVKVPTPGCIVIYNWPWTDKDTDHTGIFEKWDGKRIVVIEGNTGIGNDSNGGQVMRRVRDTKYVVAYIKPKALWEGEDDMDIDTFIKELTPAQTFKLVDKLLAHMTKEQGYKVYVKACDHMATMPLPTSWNAKEQLDKAIKDGITDGTRPMVPALRYEAALMVDRKK